MGKVVSTENQHFSFWYSLYNDNMKQRKEIWITNLLFFSKWINTKFTVKIRSEFTLSQPSLSTPTDGLVKNLFGFRSSEYLNCGLHIWYVSTISLVNLATNCKLEGEHQFTILGTISSKQPDINDNLIMYQISILNQNDATAICLSNQK